MKTIQKCLLGLLLCLLVSILATNQAHAQQKENKPVDSAESRDYNGLNKEVKTRYYYTDSEGKKKYVSNSKTQKMWTDILIKCPSCITIAEENNINIYQNKKYVKKNKEDKD